MASSFAGTDASGRLIPKRRLRTTLLNRITELEAANRRLSSELSGRDARIATLALINRRLQNLTLWGWIKSHVFGKDIFDVEQA